MMGILGYQIPALPELLQVIGIEQMSARLLTEPLIVKEYRSFINDGMEQAGEELAAKNGIGILELHDRLVWGIDRHIKAGAQISNPFHLRHTIETTENFKSTLDFLNFIFQERIGIDGEVCPFISIANDTTIERIMETRPST